jgi:hypothetical protein
LADLLIKIAYSSSSLFFTNLTFGLSTSFANFNNPLMIPLSTVSSSTILASLLRFYKDTIYEGG